MTVQTSRLSTIAKQLSQAAIRLDNIESLLIQHYTADWSDEEKATLEDSFVRELCILAFMLQLSSSRFRSTPSDYYSWSLDKRKSYLGRVPNENHLCKSLIVQNTKYDEKFATPFYYEKYYCCIIQYSSKLNSEAVSRLFRKRMSHVPRKYFNFQFAYDCESITGYPFNAVTPLAMKRRIPVVISNAIVDLDPPFIWLGGGREDVKWFVNVAQLVDAFSAIVGAID
ncbi:hypothetical protein GpartN1_g378.t1 [Galdieria partita]|uniref:YbaK/aminoacyl-tRNA synthetase-associated domain-containing protein n=1 Tax=Galdieria partita TaxID=83374 RepID=A0A9C7UMG8_9RHOD|nr:hypothetical protein GpartN1_g378.t1 [Galdieria partita]